MKRTILATCCFLIFSSVANACGGIPIKGTSGADYCLSNDRMNWYSAYTWCEAQGLNMLDLSVVCKTISGPCNELKSSIDGFYPAWTNMSFSSKNAEIIDIATGHINQGQGYARTTGFYAICYNTLK